MSFDQVPKSNPMFNSKSSKFKAKQLGRGKKRKKNQKLRDSESATKFASMLGKPRTRHILKISNLKMKKLDILWTNVM